MGYTKRRLEDSTARCQAALPAGEAPQLGRPRAGRPPRGRHVARGVPRDARHAAAVDVGGAGVGLAGSAADGGPSPGRRSHLHTVRYLSVEILSIKCTGPCENGVNAYAQAVLRGCAVANVTEVHVAKPNPGYSPGRHDAGARPRLASSVGEPSGTTRRSLEKYWRSLVISVDSSMS